MAFNPQATYRIQFHKGFTFKSLEGIIPYLRELGINTIYASPIFKAVPGSMHGYDITDPNLINPEIGTLDELKSLAGNLREKGISWLQDIVPNHMAYHPENHWLMDVMENGPQSLYVDFFDITWSSQLYNGRVMVPFLGSTIDEVFDSNELKISFKNGKLVFQYYGNSYPLHLRSYKTIINLGKPSQDFLQLLIQADEILAIESPATYSKRFEELKLQLAALIKKGGYLEKCLETINDSPEKLKKIADEQVYQLCHWQETNHRINFRRFFTINSLICLNIHEKKVFEEYHKLIKQLLKENIFQGLRVDHIDGMYDPEHYLKNLRALAGDEKYIIIEKILEHNEKLPERWPVQGTTGYDFLSNVNNVFANRKNMPVLSDFYHQLTNDNRSVEVRIREKKSNILFNRLAGELENLAHLFLELNLAEEKDNIKFETLKATIAEFLVRCPVYRFYGNTLPLDQIESSAVKNILEEIKNVKPGLSPVAEVLEKVWLVNPRTSGTNYKKRSVHFYKRIMQFTGPLMAKGVEDTLMYTYSRFIGHNEVGDSPAFTGHFISEFHNLMKERQEKWPMALNTTSTHDTKRGEDVRMRLAVLTELVDEWMECVREWKKINAPLKENNAPDNNDEYFLYQTLIGTYTAEDDKGYGERIEEYLIKSLREAKRHSNWTEPDEGYEKTTTLFAKKILKEKSPFRESFERFQKKVAQYGKLNSLSQVVLRFTCPGIPDTYQGCELWDLSLVDPDNRRSVDYTLRKKMLENVNSMEPKDISPDLWKTSDTGAIKLWLLNKLLSERSNHAAVFEQGEYIPLKVKGKYKNNVLAFSRKHEQLWYCVIIPLNVTSIARHTRDAVPKINWKNTRIILPEGVPNNLENILSGETVNISNSIKLEQVLQQFPFGIFKGENPSTAKRGAGVLLHITSLPSPFGMGDLGPEGYNFADFLNRSGQKYWQVLPLNPTSKGAGYSPYSSHASMAGNVLLISPELLVEEGLLKKTDIRKYALPPKDVGEFEKAEGLKKKLLDKAYNNFQSTTNESLLSQFDDFCNAEKHWLKDYALYMVLKGKYKNKPWYEWSEEYKKRDKKALSKIERENPEKIKKEKWLQFIFFMQWQRLKTYCNERNIKLFGDLPFYVSHDSVDVWAHPDIFEINSEGKMIGIAGVPPDYFNSNGQLWGMPVFKWKKLEKEKYSWWVQRIKKNTQLYDLLRLDHFRAFSDYWQVPAGEDTAINGQWKPGPGKKLFKRLKKELGDLPFVAEDLGDINEAVHQLRDNLGLPGMKVLQFAFGEDIAKSPHAPHNHIPNYIAYTGTHDNNTTVGWYRKDAGRTERANLEKYVGKKITQKNVNTNLSRMAYASVARIAIIPMQDLLGFDENSRMNTPATTNKNWTWRLTSNWKTNELEQTLLEWVSLYNR